MRSWGIKIRDGRATVAVWANHVVLRAHDERDPHVFRFATTWGSTSRGGLLTTASRHSIAECTDHLATYRSRVRNAKVPLFPLHIGENFDRNIFWLAVIETFRFPPPTLPLPGISQCPRLEAEIMACPCRTSSLRIFVQSLTRVQLAGSLPGPASHALGSHTFARNGTVRLFNAASAACYPRQAARGASRMMTSDPGATPAESQDTLEYSRAQSSTIAPGESVSIDSVGQLEQAKTDKAIFDLSPESIDALVAELNQTPTANTSFEDGLGAQPDAPSRRRKPELAGSSRLRRSKILPSNIKKLQEAADVPAPKRAPWMLQKNALKEKFPEGWNPRKKLSPDALDGIRALHTQYPAEFTTERLAEKFEVSPEAIRRILRAKWRPTAEEDEKRQQRWFNRGKHIWSQMAELGVKPPKQWRAEGVVRDPRWNKKRGPRAEYPYVPGKRGRDSERSERDQESTQRKLGGRLL
jgi:hypothetical protein